jgi:hypothetical protein
VERGNRGVDTAGDRYVIGRTSFWEVLISELILRRLEGWRFTNLPFVTYERPRVYGGRVERNNIQNHPDDETPMCKYQLSAYVSSLLDFRTSCRNGDEDDLRFAASIGFIVDAVG